MPMKSSSSEFHWSSEIECSLGCALWTRSKDVAFLHSALDPGSRLVSDNGVRVSQDEPK